MQIKMPLIMNTMDYWKSVFLREKELRIIGKLISCEVCDTKLLLVI